MVEISASLVKELRERSGAGMMDCKKALTESAGDMEAAIDGLRKKGLAQAAKKAGRAAAEGLVAVHVSGYQAAIVEVNAETDFVSRNEKFQEFVRCVTKLASEKAGTIEELKDLPYPTAQHSVAKELTSCIAVIGENLDLRRMKHLKINEGVIASYIHNTLCDNMGRVGVLVALESQAAHAELEKLGKSIAMHIAAAHPQSLSIDDIDPKIVAREKDVLTDKARQSGKPAEIIEKMVEGSLRKFYEEAVLLEQVYLIDDSKRKIRSLVEDKSKELGSNITLVGFAHFKLGDGVVKQETDFASEVAQLSK